MTETAKTRPQYSQYQGRAVETGAASKQATTSTKNDTTMARSRQSLKISDFLSPGQQNARPLRYLKVLTGLPGREVRRMIQRERLEGIPILSDCQHGYWLSSDPAEIKKFSRSMKRRAAEIRLTAMCVEKAVVPG